MPRHSSAARLQQGLVLLLVAAAVAWGAWCWPASPAVAIAGVLAIAAIAPAVLALEFQMLAHVSADEPAIAATRRELVRAWYGEVVQLVQVFAWRQPFRWRQVRDNLAPDTHGRRGVVFVHGFFCNRGIWAPWMRRLVAEGHACVAVNLEPVFGSIDAYARTIDEAVARVAGATGQPPMLVCHSMGGLAARAWLRACHGASRVARVVTIGSPHQGTWLGRFGHSENGRQMRQGSDWLLALSRDEAAVPFVCWYTNCDNIVFPVRTATLPHADNRMLRGVAHVALAFEPRVIEETLALLREAPSASPP